MVKSRANKTEKPAAAPKVSATDAPEKRVLRALRQIIRAVDLHSKRLKTSHGITGPQLVTLLCVAEHESITPSEIGREVQLSNSTIVGILDRLEAKGYIERERSAQDRRNVNVTVTAEGRKLVEHAPSPLQDRLSDSLRTLHPTEQIAILSSLERIAELMGADDIDAAPILYPGTIDSGAEQ